MKLVLFLCVFLSVAGTCAVAAPEPKPGFVLTGEEQAYLENLRKRPVSIAYSYKLVNAEFGGNPLGLLKPVLDVLRNEFGLTVNMLKTNWHNAFVQIESENVDFYGPIAISDTRRQKYITVDPFYRSYSKIMTRVDDPIHSMLGLYNRSIGLLEGSVISRTINTYLGPKGKVLQYPSMDDMILGLKNGEIDAFATVDNAEFEILGNDDIQFEFSIDNLYVDQGFISAREDMRMLADILNRYLRENPHVCEEINPLRRTALLLYAQERFDGQIAALQENGGEVMLYSDMDQYPLCYLENGAVRGMLPEINDIFTALTGLGVSFVPAGAYENGMLTAYDKLKTGDCMAIVGGYYDIDAWNDPDVEYSPVVWMETIRTYSYHPAGNLLGKTVGTTHFTTDYLGWNNTTGNAPAFYNGRDELVSALKDNAVDAVFMGEMRFDYGYSILGDYSLREVEGISAEAPLHMLYGARNKAFNTLYNEAINLYHIINPTSLGQWKALSNNYKDDFIRMRHSSQIWARGIIAVFVIMLAALIYLFIRNLKAHRNTRERLVDALGMALYDELTGIYNRRYMEDGLERSIKAISRADGMLSVMMLDVDFFKKYNDTYGHSEGDICLRRISSEIKNSLTRTDDFVARYGGEEFVVVLPNVDESGARIMANRILENIRKCNIPHEKNAAAGYVTISIGVTTGAAKHTQNGSDYIKRADEALYISKQSGRNRYTFVELEEGNPKLLPD